MSHPLTMPSATTGALYVLIGGLLFSAMGVLIGQFGTHYHSFQLSFFRAAFGILLLLMVLPRVDLCTLRPTEWSPLVVRAATGTAAMLCAFYSFAHLNVATATLLTFLKPLFVVPLAIAFLGEAPGWARILAIGAGFGGVVLALGAEVGPPLASVAGAAGAFLVAVVNIQIKRMTAVEKTFTITLYNELFSVLLVLPLALSVWRPVPLGDLLPLAAIGFLGVAGQFCIVSGFRALDVTVATSLDYCRFLFAVAFSVIFFGVLPPTATYVGAAVIICASLYVQFHQRLGQYVARLR